MKLFTPILSSPLIFLLCLGSAQGQDLNQTTVLVKRLAQLQAANDSLVRQLASRQTMYEQQLFKIQEERNNLLALTKDNLDYIQWFIGIIGTLMLAIISLSEIKSYSDLKKWKKNQEETLKSEMRNGIAEQLAKLTETENHTIKELIKFQETDEHLRNKIRLCVFSADEASPTASLRKLLESRFPACHILYLSQTQDWPTLLKGFKADAILLNNQNNAFGYTVDLQNPAIIDAIISQNADACIFYYTNSGFRFNALNAEAYNFSNTYATLYPNLIQLLRIRYESKPELRLRA